MCMYRDSVLQNITIVSFYNRFDLLQSIYRETDEFLENKAVLDYVSGYGKLDAVKLGASCSTEAMDLAAQSGHVEIVKYLHLNRQEGCVLALVVASWNGYFEVVTYLIEMILV